jgi:predicted Ser/Thr protein kinase
MSDNELFKALYEQNKLKREGNRVGSTKMLETAGIPFQALNNGAHLIIQYAEHKLIIDFWPGTGLWRVRHTRPEFKQRGVRKLLNYIQNRT